MAQLFVTYWRDIPSQVTARSGRRSERRMLPARFQEAIDMAAMRAGLAGTDDYLDQWRRGRPAPCEDDDMVAEVANVADRLERDYDHARLKRLIDNGGIAPAATRARRQQTG